MRALLAARSHDVIALSDAVFDEIAEVLSRGKFAGAVTLERRGKILELLTTAAAWVQPAIGVTDCVDPKDNKYLELAAACGAEVIVSSDRHLLDLNPWRGVAILRPAEYLASLP